MIGLANIVQTIPSLAMFGFLIPMPLIGGIGAKAAVIALILYALLPVMRTTVSGLKGIDPSVREAGLAMGMTGRELLFQVELPLARTAILAGVRVATVVGVGTATIAAAIGAGGLGEYIFRGVASVDGTVILAGAIPWIVRNYRWTGLFIPASTHGGVQLWFGTLQTGPYQERGRNNCRGTESVQREGAGNRVVSAAERREFSAGLQSRFI